MNVLILAAGSREHRAAQLETDTWVLQKLGDHAMIDHVVHLARRVAEPAHIYIVTDARNENISQYLGNAYHYVVQTVARGTGDAVHQARQSLAGYDGPLLILYGDTPLLRASSVMGLVARHRLKKATFSLLSAYAEETLAYGRIVRSQTGDILDILEVSDDADHNLPVVEYNIGAYVVETSRLWPALAEAFLKGTDHRLTDTVAVLAGHQERISSYHALDPDELQGINTPADLERAAFILQKRQLRPRRSEEHNEIRFGTGGWRARIGEGFTLDNVRRLCQALANEVVRRGPGGRRRAHRLRPALSGRRGRRSREPRSLPATISRSSC